MASYAYSEHVGEKRQAAGNHGDKMILYARIAFKVTVLLTASVILVLRKVLSTHVAVHRNYARVRTVSDSPQNQIPAGSPVERLGEVHALVF
jgi:hypothetical protein